MDHPTPDPIGIDRTEEARHVTIMLFATLLVLYNLYCGYIFWE